MARDSLKGKYIGHNYRSFNNVKNEVQLRLYFQYFIASFRGSDDGIIFIQISRL